MKLLVTGGTGFIGSHLAEEGRRRGAEVTVLGLTDRPEEQANTRLLSGLGAEVLSGSITDADLCRRAVRGATHVFHLAVAMREGGKSDEFFESVNLDGTRRLLEAAAEEGVQRFVYCSTIGIYGHRAPGVTREDSPLAPGNIYERTKVSAERQVREFAAGRGLPSVILRPADVYGPRDRRLLKLFKGVSRGRFPLFGPGAGRRHMIYVDDVVSGFFQACERAEALGEAVILAGPRPCTLRELIQAVQEATGSSRYGLRLPLMPMLAVSGIVEDVSRALKVDPPIYRRRMDFFWSDSEFDTSRARRVLNWEPRVELREGIRRTLEDYRRSGLLASETQEVVSG
ncbi:MAG: NAD-dependent epimerase/dehydratase family protein [Gemmatimonadales bacterium]|nr:NAD-dependent epimerase/dehydratase family protein [Gemmatimonadales bacterium]